MKLIFYELNIYKERERERDLNHAVVEKISDPGNSCIPMLFIQLLNLLLDDLRSSWATFRVVIQL